MTKFNLQFVGVGSALSMANYNNNAVIEINGKKYLIDCGISIPYALRDAKINLNEIDGLIITHIHGDHTGGVEWLGYQSKYILDKKLDLYLPIDLIEALWDKTLAGGMEDNTDSKHTLEDYFNVHVFEDLEVFKVNGLEVTPIKTVHVANKDKSKQKPSYSYVFDNRIFYSGDMLFDEELLKSLNDELEVIFHDCQLFYIEGGVHASLDELETLPDNIKQKIKVMHYGDTIDQFTTRILNNGMSIVKQFDKFEF